MTTTTSRPPTTLNAIFHWRSLRTRVTLSTLAIFLIGIWSLTSYTSLMQREDMRRLLGEQMFSTVTIIAADINDDLDDRLKALEEAAGRITPAMLGNAATMQTFLEDRIALFRMFNGGLFVARLDGTAIADVPVSAGRIGVNYSDRDWVVEILKGKSIIAAPVMGRKLKAPVIPIAAPIRDTKGKAIGFLTGVIDLGVPNFLNNITDNRYGKTGGYRLIAPQHNLFVTATDKSRIMQPLPAPGINTMHDRLMQGFEGFGIAVNSRGIEELSAAKKITVSGWFVAATLPTEEAFVPIRAMQRRMLLATIFLTMLAGGLTWWILKRQLEPVISAIKTLAAFAETDQPPQPLPVKRQDEIGALIDSFNRLLESLRQREEALKKTEELYRTILQTAMDGIWRVDMQGRLVEANEAYCRMSGYSAQELLAMHIHDLEAAETEDDTAAHIQKIMARGEDRFESRHRRKDGSIFHVAISVKYRRNDGGQFVCFLHDITDQKREEGEDAVIAEIGRVVGSTLNIDEVYRRFDTECSKLIQSDRLLVNHIKSNDHFTVAYSSGMANPARLLGEVYPRKGTTTDIVAKTRAGILIQPEIAEEIKDLYPNLYENFKKGLRSTMAVPLIAMDEVIGAISFRSKKLKAYTERDIHLAERIGMQIAGAIANAQLFNNLIKTEKSLRESEERLHRAEKMEALGQLAGGVAHDLNNILGILSGYSELLLMEIPEGSRSRGRVEKILQSTEKGAAIIQDLLTLARQGVAASDVVDLNRVVSDFLKTPVFDKLRDYHPRVTFRTECDKNLLNIKGSPVHLEKTLINLASNAAEAISGIGEVTIRTQSRHLDTPVRGYDEVKEGDYAVLTVSDTGMGIPPESREKIFEPFYTKKTMGRSGTGLGLAIVWGTVKDHNGYIDVQSEVGEGTTFTLYFPVTREELIAQQQKELIERYMGNGESV